MEAEEEVVVIGDDENISSSNIIEVEKKKKRGTIKHRIKSIKNTIQEERKKLRNLEVELLWKKHQLKLYGGELDE